MSSYHGFCSYPHGGKSSCYLLGAMTCSLVCTLYSILDCRLVTLEYASNLGNFEDHFTQRDVSQELETHRVSLGLFTWLLPSFYVDGDDDTVTRAEVGNWKEGACYGYTTLQRNVIMDAMFEAVRILGVFSVLIGLSVFCFCLLLSCISMRNWQRYTVATLSLTIGILNGLVLLMIRSGVCVEMGTEESMPSKCELDTGGLVAIAALILWTCTSLIAYFFVEPVPGEETPFNGQIKTVPKKPKVMKFLQKENQVDWNNSDKAKNSKSKSSIAQKMKERQQKEQSKEEQTMASFSIPKQSKNKSRVSQSLPVKASTPNNTRESHPRTKSEPENRFMASLFIPKNKQNQSSSKSSAKAPPRRSESSPQLDAPTMTMTSTDIMEKAPVKVKAASVASNKSLEARYIPRHSQQQQQQQQQQHSSNAGYGSSNLNSKSISNARRNNLVDLDDSEWESTGTSSSDTNHSSSRANDKNGRAPPPAPSHQPNQRYRTAQQQEKRKSSSSKQDAPGKNQRPPQAYVHKVTASHDSISSIGDRSAWRQPTHSQRDRYEGLTKALGRDLEMQHHKQSSGWGVCSTNDAKDKTGDSGWFGWMLPA